MTMYKKILFILSVIMFTSISYNVANATRDCSDPKGFHAKAVCKFQNRSFMGQSSSKDSTNTIEKKQGLIGGFFKKIKNFGGKKIGEEG